MARKKIPNAESDSWAVAESLGDGQPMLLRYRPDLHEWFGDKHYPILLQISWTYEEINSSGMPSLEQANEMGEFEEMLKSVLDDRLAILTFVHTGRGRRIWSYYIADLNKAGTQINQTLEPGYPIQIHACNDPNWDELRAVYAACFDEE